MNAGVVRRDDGIICGVGCRWRFLVQPWLVGALRIGRVKGLVRGRLKSHGYDIIYREMVGSNNLFSMYDRTLLSKSPTTPIRIEGF